MNRSKHLRAILSAGLLGALLLTGCTSDITEPSSAGTASEAPGASTPEATRAEPSASHSSIEPKLEKPRRPTGIDKTDAEAAILTAEYFHELYNYSLASGSTEGLKNLSSKGCGFCNDAIKDIEHLQRNRQRVLGAKLTWQEGRINPESINERAMDVFLDVGQAPGSIVKATGEVIEPIEADEYLVKVNVELADGSWRIAEVFGESK